MNKSKTEKLIDKFSNEESLIFFDIGSFDFSESIFLKELFPKSTIYAFEADYTNFENHKNIAIENNIMAYNMAMSDLDGEIIFYPSLFETEKKIEWRVAGSIVKPFLKENSNEAINHTVTYDVDGYNVKSVRLDSFCIKNKIEKINYIHIDVEGAEYKVLSCLDRFKPYYIFAETEHFVTKNFDNKINLSEFDIYMENIGYKISDRYEYDTLYELK